MTQKHTEHHEEHQHHPAPKHEEHRGTHERKDAERHHEHHEQHTGHETRHEEHREHEKHAGQHAGAHGSTVKVGSHEIKAENLTSQDRKYIEQHADKLSKTTLNAKWINQVGQTEDHPGQTLATRNPDVIKHWAEERGGTPATVPGTQHGDHLGVLRINFPGYGGQKLEPVTWDQWFKTFNDRKLVFLFQQKMREGNQSNFFHLDSPEREHD